MKDDYLMSVYKRIFLKQYVNVFMNKFKIKELTDVQNYALFDGLLNNISIACYLIPEAKGIVNKAHSLVFLTYAGQRFNRYGLPTKITLVDNSETNSLSGRMCTVDKNVVLCYLDSDIGGKTVDNHPLIYILRRYAADKAVKRVLLNRAAKRLSIPWLINAGSVDQEELEQINQKLYSTDNLLISTTAAEDIIALQTSAKSDVLSELYNDLCCFDDEAYTLMGCPAPSFREKKERMLTNEIDVHMLRGRIFQDIMVKSINAFLKRIDKVFGIKLSLIINDVYKDMKKDEQKETKNDPKRSNK